MPIQTFLAACALVAGCSAPWQALTSFTWPDGDPSLHASRRAACVAEGGCVPVGRRTVEAVPAALAADLPPSAAADGMSSADGAASGGGSATPLGGLLLAVLGALLFVGRRTRGGRDH